MSTKLKVDIAALFLLSKYLQTDCVFCLVCWSMIANSTDLLLRKNLTIPTILAGPERTEVEKQFPDIYAYNERLKKWWNTNNENEASDVSAWSQHNVVKYVVALLHSNTNCMIIRTCLDAQLQKTFIDLVYFHYDEKNCYASAKKKPTDAQYLHRKPLAPKNKKSNFFPPLVSTRAWNYVDALLIKIGGCHPLRFIMIDRDVWWSWNY